MKRKSTWFLPRISRRSGSLLCLALLGAPASKAADLGGYGIPIADVSADACGHETTHHVDSTGISIVRSVYGHLDLGIRAKQVEQKGEVKALVPMGPVMVTGEGEDPENHTVIRILDKYQLPESQFLAFPPAVKGGVGVESIPLDSPGSGFVAWPLLDAVNRNLVLFNRHGGKVREIAVDKSVPAPFVVAVGDFVPSRPGVEIAVASRFVKSPVLLLGIDGGTILSLPEGPSAAGKRGRSLTSVRWQGQTSLIVQDLDAMTGTSWQEKSGFSKLPEIQDLPPGARVFPSIFTNNRLLAGFLEHTVSTLYRFLGKGPWQPTDIGLRENSFLYNMARTHGSQKSDWPKIEDTKYVREIGSFGAFFQAQDWSPVVKSGNIKNLGRDQWLAGMNWETYDFLAPNLKAMAFPHSNYQAGGLRAATSPNFSHRWTIEKVKAVAERVDPQGLPEYLALDRSNRSKDGGYFGKTMFTYGSYNFEQPELSDFYHTALWEYYRRLAKTYRTCAENLALAKPSHENEIVTGKGSLGDYNPKNIRGFYRYLLAMYGSMKGMATSMKVDFTEKEFDAPRNFDRGEWDRYSKDNPFFREWIEYNRITVYRRVGEALLGVVIAGIPPQLTRTHQIPDFAIGGTIGIADNVARITPVDWLLTAGTGFGYTRYGLWYQNECDMAKSAHTSGFDDVYIGEYASKAKTAQADMAYEQLKYCVENGIKGGLVMAWPDEGNKAGYNDTQYAALQKIHQTYGNTPLPGLAGGIGQVRGYKGPAGSFDIVSMGITGSNTGLLKSVDEGGRFEGTVYVSPFHAHVNIDTLLSRPGLELDANPQALCTEVSVRQGCVIEINFDMEGQAPVTGLEIRVQHRGFELPDQTTRLPSMAKGNHARVVYKFPVIMDQVSLTLACPSGKAKVKDLQVYRHQDMAANLSLGLQTGQRHKGGVRFDILTE